MSKIAIVIPNYNGIEYIANCLNSLQKQSVADFDVIVVDNHSMDGSKELVLKEFPEVICVERDNNGGFSVAVNVGISKAKELGAEFVFLLNNDTVADAGLIEKLVQAIESDDNIFSVQAKMLSLKEPELIDDAGDFYTVLGWAYARGKGKSAKKYQKRTRIFAACAGAAMYRMEYFDKIGLFDELHFAYLEDVDIGYRARLYGYDNMYEPDAIVYHAGSASSGSRYNEFKIRLAARNSVYLIYKNQTILQKILHFVPMLCGFLIKQFFFILKGHGKVYHEAVMEGIKMCRTETAKSARIGLVSGHLKDALKVELELWGNIFRKLLG